MIMSIKTNEKWRYGVMNTSNLDHIKAEIHKDVKDHPESFFILDEGDDFIEYEDETAYGYHCRYEDMDNITKDWIRDRIVVSSSIKKLDIDDIAAFVFENIPRNIYRTLHRLVFIRDDEADFEEFEEQLESITGYPLLEVHDFPENGQIGIAWVIDCTAVVHLGNIEKVIDRQIECGDLEEWEKQDELDIGIKSTIAHELRHLAQNDLYLESDFAEDEEEDAEQFARNVMDAYLGYKDPLLIK